MSNSTDVGRELNFITALFSFICIKPRKTTDRTHNTTKKEGDEQEWYNPASWKTMKVIKKRNSCNEKLTWRMLQAIFCYGGISSSFPMCNLCYVRILSFLVPIPFNWIITRNAFTTYQGPIKLTLSALDKCCFSWPPLHYISSHCKSFLQFLGYSLRPGNWIKRRYAR